MWSRRKVGNIFVAYVLPIIIFFITFWWLGRQNTFLETKVFWSFFMALLFALMPITKRLITGEKITLVQKVIGITVLVLLGLVAEYFVLTDLKLFVHSAATAVSIVLVFFMVLFASFARYGIFLPAIAHGAPERLCNTLSWLIALQSSASFFSAVGLADAFTSITVYSILFDYVIANFIVLYFRKGSSRSWHYGLKLFFEFMGLFLILLSYAYLFLTKKSPQFFSLSVIAAVIYIAGTYSLIPCVRKLVKKEKFSLLHKLTYSLLIVGAIAASFVLYLPLTQFNKIIGWQAGLWAMVMIVVLTLAATCRYGLVLPAIARGVSEKLSITLSWLFILVFVRINDLLLTLHFGKTALKIYFLGTFIGLYLLINLIILAVGYFSRK